MSKRRSPFERVFQATFLIFGFVVLLWLSLRVLETIWGWLLLAAAGIVLGVVIWRVIALRRSRW